MPVYFLIELDGLFAIGDGVFDLPEVGVAVAEVEGEEVIHFVGYTESDIPSEGGFGFAEGFGFGAVGEFMFDGGHAESESESEVGSGVAGVMVIPVGVDENGLSAGLDGFFGIGVEVFFVHLGFAAPRVFEFGPDGDVEIGFEVVTEGQGGEEGAFAVGAVEGVVEDVIAVGDVAVYFGT